MTGFSAASDRELFSPLSDESVKNSHQNHDFRLRVIVSFGGCFEAPGNGINAGGHMILAAVWGIP
jgi:hypothetical protein